MAAPKGEKNGRAKLTAARVARAKATCRKDPKTNKSALARKYGVSPRAMYAALSGETWKLPRRRKSRR